MLKSLSFSNFYSFAEETEISFSVAKNASPSLYDVHMNSGDRLSKVTAVMGPNGSGKTQFLKSLSFLGWFVADSFLSSDPVGPILCDPHALKTEEPIRFEMFFYLDHVEHKYNLIIQEGIVVHESLYEKTSRLFSYLFVREYDFSSESYNVKTKNFAFKKAADIRTNSSLICAAHSYDVQAAAKFVTYFDNISTNLSVAGRHLASNSNLFESAEFFEKHATLKESMIQLVCQLDLGISDIEFEKIKSVGKNGEELEWILPVSIHQSDKGSFRLPFFEESSGTQSAMFLLRILLPVLAEGGLAVFDELDNDLHPLMLPKILDLFMNEGTNPHNAQLLFTCHSPEVLTSLKKHQVYLVEKYDQVSDAWRLDDVVGLRSDDNLYAKYMAGALEAVPNF